MLNMPMALKLFAISFLGLHQHCDQNDFKNCTILLQIRLPVLSTAALHHLG